MNYCVTYRKDNNSSSFLYNKNKITIKHRECTRESRDNFTWKSI